MNKPELSIIILSHNTKALLEQCLKSVFGTMGDLSIEVIYSDNASTDGSTEMARKKFPKVKIVSGPNIGFSNGNNRARSVASGEYILFLNSDTIVCPNVFSETLKYMRENKSVGALTCKLVLPNGKLDRDVRRKFPTPWGSFFRIFFKLGFSYWYDEISENNTHEVDAIQGAFFLTRKKILEKVGWFDENYYFQGEDLDLSYQIRKLGYKIVYFPKVYVTHLKGATKKGKSNGGMSTIDKKTLVKRRMDTVHAMEYFYIKNLWDKYPIIFNYFVLSGIKLLKFSRFVVATLSTFKK